MRESTKTALSVAVVIALAVAFWMLLLAPKREKADELAEQQTALTAEVGRERTRIAEGEEAKGEFPRYYRELVVMGKAVPAEAATPSLLVQLNGVSARSETSFVGISKGGEAGGESEEGAETTVPATESAAALLPLGATVGPAGFSAMPYTLDFEGGFFDIADFIEGLDSFVTTAEGVVVADGRLVTIDGFNLAPGGGEAGEGPSSDELAANFSVTTYVTPPGQGLTAGATAAGPAEATP